MRSLRIQNRLPRAEQAILVQTLSTLFDGSFSENSYDGRPGRGRLDAFARIERFLLKCPGAHLATLDVKDAFPNVQISPLETAMLAKFGSPHMVAWASSLVRVKKKRGLVQGGPLSPFLFNLVRDHYVDRRFADDDPDLMSLYFLDDILIVGKNRSDVEARIEEVRRRLRGIGMQLKNPNPRVRRCDVFWQEWLGYRFKVKGASLVVELGGSELDEFASRLARCQGKPNSIVHAEACCRGFMGAWGPALQQDEPAEATIRKVAHALHAQGFGELCDDGWLHRLVEQSRETLDLVRSRVVNRLAVAEQAKAKNIAAQAAAESGGDYSYDVTWTDDGEAPF